MTLLLARLAIAGEPRLPVLVYQELPAYPERALERAIEGDVLVEVTVDEDGRVVDARLVEGAGHGFDAPAVASAWSMQFEPALDENGRPAAAVVQVLVPYRMAFVVPLSAAGEVRERGGKKLVAGARLRAVGPDDQIVRTVSDEKGAFRFAGMDPGTWVLTVDGPGLITSSASFEVPEDGYVDGLSVSVERVPEWQEGDPTFDEYVEVVTEIAPEPAERVLTHEEIVSLPGSLGDPVRALQNLPGVARAPFGSGQLLVRGTNASDTGYYLDGMRIPLAFHFTAVSTVVPADLLAQVSLSTGGYGARYGRALGGVVELDTNDDLPRRSTTSVSADVFQATVFTRQRLGQSTALSLSARRSYVDALLSPVLADLGAQSVRLPRFYDASVHLVHQLEGRGRVTGTFLLSEDRFRLIGASGIDAVTYRTAFQKVIGRWIQPTGTGWDIQTSFAAGPEVQSIELSGEEADLGSLGIPIDLFGSKPGTISEESPMRVAFRHDWIHDPGDGHVGLRMGLDWSWGRQELVYALGETDESGSRAVSQPAVWVEPTLRWGPLDVVPGMRAELTRLKGVSGTGVVDPRLAARLRPGSTTEITANVGWYSQPPASRELLSEEGPTLTFERSFLVGAGVDQRLGPDLDLGLGLYHQTLWDLITGRDNLFRFDRTSLFGGEDNGPFQNEATGVGYGVELHGTWDDDVNLLWLSLTLSRALRTPWPGAEQRPAEADQPVNLVLIASRRIHATRLGARLRFASGAATTPVQGGAYAVDLQEWLPLYGDPWSDRLPSFFAIDLRADHDLRIRRSRIDLYGELQNVTNRSNVEIAGYSPDYSEFRPTYGLPIFPAFGLEVTF